MATLLDKTKALRAEAWEALMSSPHFRDFKVLDEAVVALGGTSEMPSANSEGSHARMAKLAAVIAEKTGNRRISHATAALQALRDEGEPLPIGRLMEKAIANGAEIGGNNPIGNFRSTLSKDPRFRSISRNNMYFWWFVATPVPRNWNEAPDLPLDNGSDASVSHASQEGGDGHAATMAH